MSISIEIDDQEVKVDKFLGVLQREFGREVVAEGEFDLAELKKYRGFLIEAIKQLMLNDLSEEEERIMKEIEEYRTVAESNLYNKLNDKQQELYDKLFKGPKFDLTEEDEEIIAEKQQGLEEFLDDILEDLSDEEINLIEAEGDNSKQLNNRSKKVSAGDKVVDINKYRNR